jgi:hypothetical protein
MSTIYAVPIRVIDAFNKALGGESDRGRVLIAAMWMDLFLTCKLKNEFGKGNSKARRRLFNAQGPFSSLSAKIDAAFCAGWITADLHNDMHRLRDMRNDCAHDLNFAGLNDETLSKNLAAFKTPHRQFHDWGKLKAAGTVEGAVVIYTGERPTEAIKDLDFTVPGNLTFPLVIPVLLTVLISQLRIPLVVDDKGQMVIPKLPDYMNDAEPRASPNGGAAMPPGNSEATDAPPSVT